MWNLCLPLLAIRVITQTLHITVYSVATIIKFKKQEACCETEIYLAVINIIRGVKLFDKSSNVLNLLKPLPALHSHHITRVSLLYTEYTHLQNTFYKKIIIIACAHTCFEKTSEYFICNKHCYGLSKSVCLT